MSRDFFGDIESDDETENNNAPDVHVGVSVVLGNEYPHALIQSTGITSATNGNSPEFEIIAVPVHSAEAGDISNFVSPLIRAIVDDEQPLNDGDTIEAENGTDERTLLVKKLPGTNRVRLIMSDENNNLDPETMDERFRYQFDLNSSPVQSKLPADDFLSKLVEAAKKGELGKPGARVIQELLTEHLKERGGETLNSSAEESAAVAKRITENIPDKYIPAVIIAGLLAQHVKIAKISALLEDIFPNKAKKVLSSAASDIEHLRSLEKGLITIGKLIAAVDTDLPDSE